MSTLKPRPRLVILDALYSRNYHVNTVISPTGYNSAWRDYYNSPKYPGYVCDTRTLELVRQLEQIPGVKVGEIESDRLVIHYGVAYLVHYIEPQVIQLLLKHLGWRDQAPLAFSRRYAASAKLFGLQLQDKFLQYTSGVDIVYPGQRKPARTAKLQRDVNCRTKRGSRIFSR
jgi:hypothetical protein